MNNDAMTENLSKILELLPNGLSETEKAEAQRIRGNLKNLSGVEQDPQKEKERQLQRGQDRPRLCTRGSGAQARFRCDL